MTAALLVTFGLAAAAVAFVMAPLWRSASDRGESRSESSDALTELRSQREMLLGALRDLEDDRAMEKIDPGDYATMKTRLSAQAIEVIDRLERLEASAAPAAPAGGAVLPYRGSARPDPPR